MPTAAPSHTVFPFSTMPVGGSLTSVMLTVSGAAKMPPCPSLASTQIVLLGVASKSKTTAVLSVLPLRVKSPLANGPPLVQAEDSV